MKLQSGYAFTLLLLLAGCGGGSGSSDSGTTQLSLAISDAPVDSVQQVCIAVSRINLNSVTGWGRWRCSEQPTVTVVYLDGYAIPTDTSGNLRFFISTY